MASMTAHTARVHHSDADPSRPIELRCGCGWKRTAEEGHTLIELADTIAQHVQTATAPARPS